jgi:hypothetical protein
MHTVNFDQIEYSQWTTCLEKIKKYGSKDALFENYINLDPSKFLYFSFVLKNNEIISFGAIEYNPHKWGEKLCRVLTRFWIDPEYRSQSLTKWSNTSTRYSPLVLKHQLEYLETNEQIEIAMITREGRYKKSFVEIVRLANSVSKNKFSILDGRYNVCGNLDYVPDSCVQMVAMSAIKETDIKENVKQLEKHRYE